MPEGRLQRTRENYPEGVPKFGASLETVAPPASIYAGLKPSQWAAASIAYYQRVEDAIEQAESQVASAAPATEPPAVPSTLQAAETGWCSEPACEICAIRRRNLEREEKRQTAKVTTGTVQAVMCPCGVAVAFGDAHSCAYTQPGVAAVERLQRTLRGTEHWRREAMYDPATKEYVFSDGYRVHESKCDI